MNAKEALKITNQSYEVLDKDVTHTLDKIFNDIKDKAQMGFTETIVRVPLYMVRRIANKLEKEEYAISISPRSIKHVSSYKNDKEYITISWQYLGQRDTRM